jgi:hypothetical protein
MLQMTTISSGRQSPCNVALSYLTFLFNLLIGRQGRKLTELAIIYQGSLLSSEAALIITRVHLSLQANVHERHLTFCPHIKSAYENNYVMLGPIYVTELLKIYVFSASSKRYVSPSHQSLLIEIMGLSHPDNDNIIWRQTDRKW